MLLDYRVCTSVSDRLPSLGKRSKQAMIRSWEPLEKSDGEDEEHVGLLLNCTPATFITPTTTTASTTKSLSSPRHKRVKSNIFRSRSKYPSRTHLFVVIFGLLGAFAYFANRHGLAHTHVEPQPVSARPARTSTLLYNDVALNDKAIVLASYEGQDTSWVEDVPADWTVYRYNLKGREARAYLTYIIANYHNLPDYTIFHHGANVSWHQIEPISWKVRALNLSALDREGYINLRCEHDSGCTEDSLIGAKHDPIALPHLQDMLGSMTVPFWKNLLQPYGFGPLPDDIGHQCCAQFAVTRSAIQARSLDFYRDYRAPLEKPVEEGKKIFGPRWDHWHAGGLYEYMWHIVFGKEALYCPAEDKCRKEFFSDAITCDKYPGRFQNAKGWEDVKCYNIWDHEETVKKMKGSPAPVNP